MPSPATVAGRAALCGSVTLARNSQMDSSFTSLTVRRLCLRITNTIAVATRWAVFEQGGPHLADRVHAQVSGYLAGLAQIGAFANDFFHIDCECHCVEDSVDSRRGLSMLLSFQPHGAERVYWLTLHQTAQGCRVASTAFAPATEECA